MKKNERNCPQCRSTISKSAHLCKYCGKRFDDGEIVEQPSQRPESDETGPISALGCFGLLIGGVMLFNHLTSGEGRTANSSSTTEATQPYADRGKQETWIAAAQISVKKRLKDPSSAEFRNVHFYSGGKAAVACGEVNAKNSFGGYSGYGFQVTRWHGDYQPRLSPSANFFKLVTHGLDVPRRVERRVSRMQRLIDFHQEKKEFCSAQRREPCLLLRADPHDPRPSWRRISSRNISRISMSVWERSSPLPVPCSAIGASGTAGL